MEQTFYWFNVRTRQVETVYDKGQSKDLLGPYHSAAEAAQALELAQQRTEAWDEEDRQWSEGEKG